MPGNYIDALIVYDVHKNSLNCPLICSISIGELFPQVKERMKLFAALPSSSASGVTPETFIAN